MDESVMSVLQPGLYVLVAHFRFRICTFIDMKVCDWPSVWSTGINKASTCVIKMYKNQQTKQTVLEMAATMLFQ